MECSALTGLEKQDKSLAAAANAAVENRKVSTSCDVTHLQLTDDNRSDATYLPLTKQRSNDASYRQLTDNCNALSNSEATYLKPNEHHLTSTVCAQSDATYLEPIQNRNAFNKSYLELVGHRNESINSEAAYLEPFEKSNASSNCDVTYRQLVEDRIDAFNNSNATFQQPVKDANNINALDMQTSHSAAANDEFYAEIPDLPNADYAEVSDISDNDSSISFHTRSAPRLPRPVNTDNSSAEQIPLSVANNVSGIWSNLTYRIKVAAVVGGVCVGASITALAIAVILLSRVINDVQHKAAGANSHNHITIKADGIFAVEESSTDLYSSFNKNFQIKFTDVYVTESTITRSFETFQIKFHHNFIDTNSGKPTGDFCATVKLLACRNYSIELHTQFGIKTRDGNLYHLTRQVSQLTLNNTLTYILTSRAYILDPANRALDRDMLTIKTAFSYIINSQHHIKPSQAKLKRGVHTSVNMSYTWTLRHLTLPITNAVSPIMFAGLGAAEFFIQIMIKITVDGFFYIKFVLHEAPELVIKFPLQVNYTYELIDNACGLVENAVLDRNTGLELYTSKRSQMNISDRFNYSNVKMLVEKYQCITIRYRVVYDVVSNNTPV